MSVSKVPLRRPGRRGPMVSPVAMGCWPITGITSIDVNREQSLATLEAAFEAGVNFFDTAYAYGYEGESERMIAEVFGSRRDQICIATKLGLHWEDGSQVRDSRALTLRRECEESLRRLGTDSVDLLYLHAPDPEVPIEEVAETFADLQDEGFTRAVGVSNVDVDTLRRFHAICEVTAIQPGYNMLQRDIEHDLLPFCEQHDIATCVYWPLMKGLLAGKLERDHRWDPDDKRQRYPIFQGEAWERTHDLVDELRTHADDWNRSVAEIVVGWTIRQPNITVALCGAKRPEQIRETAAAMQRPLSDEQLAIIDRLLTELPNPLAS